MAFFPLSSTPEKRKRPMKIALLPGDGIGPKIVAEAVKVLKALALPLEMQEAAQ